MTAPTEPDDDSVTMTAEPGVVDRLVEALAPSLTTEQAQGLASRWAFWHAGLKQCADNAEFDREMSKAPMLLSAPETTQLFAWVRARLAVLAPTRPDRVELSYYIALDLDLPMESTTPAMALCEAAGWPS